MKLMTTTLMALAMTLGFAATSFAEDGVIKQDQQRVEQDRADVKKDNQNLKTANDTVKADKASGNTDQLKKDRVARHEARRNKIQDKSRLQTDKAQKQHDEAHP